MAYNYAVDGRKKANLEGKTMWVRVQHWWNGTVVPFGQSNRNGILAGLIPTVLIALVALLVWGASITSEVATLKRQAAESGTKLPPLMRLESMDKNTKLVHLNPDYKTAWRQREQLAQEIRNLDGIDLVVLEGKYRLRVRKSDFRSWDSLEGTILGRIKAGLVGASEEGVERSDKSLLRLILRGVPNNWDVEAVKGG